MVREWRRIPLGEFVSLQRGHDLPDDQRRPGNVPILGSFGITGWHDESRASGPGVTIGRSGASFGVASYSPADYWPLNTALYVTNFHGNDERFAYYFLKCFDFQGYNSGSAQPSLNRNFIHPVLIDVPGPEEQRAVAHVLATLDDKIELNRCMNETLEAMARALFKSWFVDFDPVRAKSEGRDPDLPSDIADLFPDSFDKSELGDIPKGWQVRLLSEVTEQIRRGLSPKYLDSGGVLVLNQKCIRDGRVDVTHARRHDNSSKPVTGRTICSGDVLVNSTGVGTLGRVAKVWKLSEPDTIVDSHVTVVRAAPAEVSASYLAANLSGREAEIEGLGEGSTGQTELARTRLGSLNLLVPPSSVQTAFDAFIRPIFDRTTEAEVQSKNLALVRDSLLPKLISGELRVPEAEELLEAVA